MKKTEYKVEQRHIDTLHRLAPELIEAEAKVDAIKKSKEWKNTYEYFNVLKHRGYIKTKPTKKNGYKLELWDNVVSIDALESILTPEQMKQVKQLKAKGGM